MYCSEATCFHFVPCATHAPQESDADSEASQDAQLRFYALRYADVYFLHPHASIEDKPLPVVAWFVSKAELFAHCKQRNIKLGLTYDLDTSGTNYTCDMYIVCGYDYVQVDHKTLTTQTHEISGESRDD